MTQSLDADSAPTIATTARREIVHVVAFPVCVPSAGFPTATNTASPTTAAPAASHSRRPTR